MRPPAAVVAAVLGPLGWGVLAGVAWALVAPAPPPAGSAALDPYAPAAEAFIAADGWFALITGVAGLAVGALALWRARSRSGYRTPGRPHGYPSVTALGGRVVASGALSALVAWGVGVAVSPLGLGALGVLCAWPIGSLVMVVVAVAVHGRTRPAWEQSVGRSVTPAGLSGPSSRR